MRSIVSGRTCDASLMCLLRRPASSCSSIPQVVLCERDERRLREIPLVERRLVDAVLPVHSSLAGSPAAASVNTLKIFSSVKPCLPMSVSRRNGLYQNCGRLMDAGQASCQLLPNARNAVCIPIDLNVRYWHLTDISVAPRLSAFGPKRTKVDFSRRWFVR